jgi:hypothetical protein
VSAREKAIAAWKALLNGSAALGSFEDRSIEASTVKDAWIGYDSRRKAFTYPCVAKGGGLLGIHLKSEDRDAKGKRRQWWEGHADDLPRKGHGKRPDEPAKIIPFGMETLEGLEPGSRVVLCCGEEDSLSMRQAGFTALSQPGAGLLEPVYAAELAGFEVVVFYDAGEQEEARKDAIKVLEAGAAEVRVGEWPPDALHGADINGRLVEDPEGFEGWVAGMISSAKSLSTDVTPVDREGVPDTYAPPAPPVPESRPWPTLRPEALYGLPGQIVRAIEPETEADRMALLANLLVAFGNAIGRGSYARVGPDRHHLNLDVVLVGETAKGRKGMSWGPIRELMHAVDPEWADERVQNGLSSGEGLIYAVRDRETTDEDEED